MGRLCGDCQARPCASFDVSGGRFSVGRVSPLCGHCMDRRATEYEVAERLRAEKAAADRLASRIAAAGIPAQFCDGRLEGARFDSCAETVLEAWGTTESGVVLEGPVGVGKTTLAGLAAWRYVRRRSLRWTTAPLLMARLGSGFGTEGKEWATAVIGGDHALVLDDADKARPTAYGAEILFAAIDQRISHEVPLLVTTNSPIAELATRWPEPYGEAIASRLASCRLVRLDGIDRRLA